MVEYCLGLVCVRTGKARGRPNDNAASAKLAAFSKVDLIGLEPTTSSMPWKRSPN